MLRTAVTTLRTHSRLARQSIGMYLVYVMAQAFSPDAETSATHVAPAATQNSASFSSFTGPSSQEETHDDFKPQVCAD